MAQALAGYWDKESLVKKYLDTLAVKNENSAKIVGHYLRDFNQFTKEKLRTSISDLIAGLKKGNAIKGMPKEEQVYEILSQYASFLKSKIDSGQNSARTVKFKIYWARTLMEFNYIAISKTLFNAHVKTARPEDPDLSPIDRQTICKVISKCEDIRMMTFTMWLASMGWRAKECLSIQNQNFESLSLKTLKFADGPAYVNVSGKNAKTKKGKRRPITTEMKNQLEAWLAHKYRSRVIKRKINGAWVKDNIVPEPRPTDLIFMPYHQNAIPLVNGTLQNAYRLMSHRFARLMDRLDTGHEIESARHKVTFHTFRRYCYTTCTRNVDESYAKFHIGRKIHEYDKRTDEEKLADFQSVEPFLTYLDTASIETFGKDTKAKFASLETSVEQLKGMVQDLMEERKRLLA